MPYLLLLSKINGQSIFFIGNKFQPVDTVPLLALFTNSHNHLLVGEFLENVFTDICLTNDVRRCVQC